MKSRLKNPLLILLMLASGTILEVTGNLKNYPGYNGPICPLRHIDYGWIFFVSIIITAISIILFYKFANLKKITISIITIIFVTVLFLIYSIFGNRMARSKSYISQAKSYTASTKTALEIYYNEHGNQYPVGSSYSEIYNLLLQSKVISPQKKDTRVNYGYCSTDGSKFILKTSFQDKCLVNSPFVLNSDNISPDSCIPGE